ncbi:hypothetical protein P7C73_g5216, partial [Tremellales sp. Uapishka_1]
MASTPPLSPVPRRWRAQSASPHPVVQQLMTSVESTSTSSTTTRWSSARESRDEDEEDEVDNFLSALGSPTKSSSKSSNTPEIRTTSPSPGRPTSPTRSAISSEDRLSPLLPPNRGLIFDDQSRVTGTKGNLSGGFGSMSGPRDRNAARHFRHPSPHNPSQMSRQNTGQSTSTTDLAYDAVLSTLDALANSAGTSSEPNKRTSPAPVPSTSPNRSLVGLGLRMGGDLEAVSERTEPSSTTHSRDSSPQPRGRVSRIGKAPEPMSVSSIANRFPLPPRPVKG